MIGNIRIELDEIGRYVGCYITPHDFNAYYEVKDCASHQREDGIDIVVAVAAVIVAYHGASCFQRFPALQGVLDFSSELASKVASGRGASSEASCRQK